MNALEPCSWCRRHVRRGARCPFCAARGVGVALAVALVVAPGVAHADAGDAETSDGGAEVADAAEATDDAEDARAAYVDEGRHVVPLYGAPPDRSRGGGGCATTAASASDSSVAVVGAMLALTSLRRRRR